MNTNTISDNKEEQIDSVSVDEIDFGDFMSNYIKNEQNKQNEDIKQTENNNTILNPIPISIPIPISNINSNSNPPMIILNEQPVKIKIGKKKI